MRPFFVSRSLTLGVRPRIRSAHEKLCALRRRQRLRRHYYRNHYELADRRLARGRFFASRPDRESSRPAGGPVFPCSIPDLEEGTVVAYAL